VKNVQDALRKRQALLISAVITLLCVALYVMFAHQKRLTEVSEGVNALVTQLTTVFNDNELIADATGVRFQQIKSSHLCGSLTDFTPQGSGTWAINGGRQAISFQQGTIISRERSENVRCIYAAAEFIRHRINALNSGYSASHRYIVASDANWFYWFSPADSRLFDFSTSQMASNPEAYFKPPQPFYDRLLQKNLSIKSRSSTDFYIDQITGEKAFSIVSYIYDLSGVQVSDNIVGYLVYDHSRPELLAALRAGFPGSLPAALMVELGNKRTGETLCLTGECYWRQGEKVRQLSEKYYLRYALPVYLFAINDPLAWRVILLAPVVFLLLSGGIRRRLNYGDTRMYTDPLTGCFTRKILDPVRKYMDDRASVILVDCNKFKAINDTWGHEVGDRALQTITRLMMAVARPQKDWVIRTGGDEFIILLEHTPLDEARAMAQRVAQRIAGEAFMVDGKALPLSVSWGVASFAQDLDTTIQQADADMYCMKVSRQGAMTSR